MHKKYLLIPLFILIGLIQADLSCVGIANPHLGDTLNIHCATQPSQSTCIANVSDVDANNYILSYPNYPPNTLQEFKQPYLTSNDGQFEVSIFINNQLYYADSNYTSTITCFNPLDNSTNQTDFNFAPILYRSIGGQVVEVLVWLKSELLLLIFTGFLILFGLGIILLGLRATGFI